MSETNISTPTKCKRCGHLFTDDLLKSATILGATPQAKLNQVAALVNPLVKHLQKKHPEALQAAQLAGGEFAGYLSMQVFECDEDTRMKMGMDFTRWNVHRLTARPEAHPSDERIAERVEAAIPQCVPFNCRHLVKERLTALLCEMRDAIEEKDRYQKPSTSSNVAESGANRETAKGVVLE